MRIALAFCFAAFPFVASAQCEGQDVRANLSPENRAEITASAAAERYGEGNFWQATRGDRSITLIGTVHLGDPRLDGIAEAFRDEISAADQVFLEMTSVEQEQLKTALASDPAMILLSDHSLIDLLPQETWAVLKAGAEARGLPGPMAARMQPWYLSMILALPPCALAGGPPEGLDAMVEEIAREADVPAFPLEPYDTLFRIFAEEPLDTQIDFLTASVQDTGTSEDMLATTLNLYFEEAPAELWHLSRVMARTQTTMPAEELDVLFAELEEALLFERNRAWLPLLEDAEGDRIVAAFGAAHLFGDDGVLHLLEQAGYVLTRLKPE
ncbi:TraB/GumN family protein [Primorskyibacter sp. S187A]|uniref:TraB/GumN family protein n=1 Tax=Primorskyibacter sp. S187A TaxID=3415130 RepID=UPI003C7EBEE0